LGTPSLSKYYALTIHALHILSANWREHLQPDSQALPDLSPQELLILHEAQAVHQHITLAAIQTLHPYIPPAHIESTILALTQKGLFQNEDTGIYTYSPQVQGCIRALDQAVVSSCGALHVLSRGQADRLAVLMGVLNNRIAYGPNLIETPIFNLILRSLLPSEEALAQVHQQLIALLAYRDDAHINAWHTEGYTAPAIRLATQLYSTNETLPLARLLALPFFFDEDYVQTGLNELTQRGDILETGIGYSLTAKGVMRRARVEQLTDDYFDAALETHLSEAGRKDWNSLLTLLIEGSKTTLPISTQNLKGPLTRNLSDQPPN
jgi:hypothetical protein